MLKTLMKKQLLENVAFMIRNPKNGKKRGKGALIGFIVLYAYIFAIFGFIFFKFGDLIWKPYSMLNLQWLYFSLFGILATSIGIFMSLFTVYSNIYQAKDNELLLSLPIPPSSILITKISSCYLMAFITEALVLIPCYIVYFINSPFSPGSLLIGILNVLIMPLLAVAVGCILGWLVALIAAKIKKNIKTIAIILVSVVFLGGYYYVMADASKFMNMFIAHPEKVADVARSTFYPFYIFGKGCLGDIKSLLIFSGIAAAVILIVLFVLSKTFISLATKNKGSNTKKFQKHGLSSANIDRALLKRDFSRLASSSVYILNCCMGCILTVIALVFTILKREILFMIPVSYVGIIACLAVALLSSMNDITAPSVSLEGKSLWIIQSMPVDSWKVLKSKIKVHMIVSLIPILVFVGVIEAIFDMTLVSRIMLPVYAVLFTLYEALFGLMLNIKMPNLTWTNETVAVKQSGSILLAILGSMGIVILLSLPYIIWHEIFEPDVYIILSAMIILIATVIIYMWVKKRGTKIFSKL